MRILVTGGAGFIGSHVVDRYVALGHEVAVADNLATGRQENLNPAARFYPIDIRDRAALEAVCARERPHVVNHHAAQADLRRATDDPVHDALVNVVGAVNVLECAARSGVGRVIYSSSGGAVYGRPDVLPVSEDQPPRPVCAYGASKLAVEHYLDAYHNAHGMESVVLRYPNVYGPRQRGDTEAGVVAVFLARMLADRPCVIRGDGEQARDFLHVADCAAANVLALEAGPGVYNLGWGELVTVNQVFHSLARVTGYARPPQHAPPRTEETYRIALDASLARRRLGWAPGVRWPDGLTSLLPAARQGGADPGRDAR